MSDAEHLIENAILALERYPYEEAERYFMEAPINIMMSKDSGCPLNAVWEMAIYCDTTLRQDWKEKWEKEIDKLSKMVDNYESCLRSVEVIRANAIREFAEKLKSNILRYGFSHKMAANVHIDSLVKEMTEGINDENR